MSREEDLIRSTTRAIAATVREVPALDLGLAAEAAPAAGSADELRSPAGAPGGPHAPQRGPRDLRGPRGPRGPRSRRSPRSQRGNWRAWALPVTAAALVVALSVSLVLARNVQNGGPVPASSSSSSAAGPDGVPRYYVARATATAEQQGATGITAEDLVVGDSWTGKTLATIRPPARTTFQSISAAADDRTFVVYALTSSTGSFLPDRGATMTASWYELVLAPGTSHPARLTKLPVKPWSWVDGPNGPALGQVFAMALSGNGRELAIAEVPGISAAAAKPGNWFEVKVISVATGRLLQDWTSDSSAVTPESLTWIDGDRALALTTDSSTPAPTATGTVYRLDLAGPTSGNLMNDAAVIWSGTLRPEFTDCISTNDWPPLVSADGRAAACTGLETPGHIDFDTVPLQAGTPGGVKPTVVYRATYPAKNAAISQRIVWISPAGDSLIVKWQVEIDNRAPDKYYFGAVSHGQYTPLRIPASLVGSALAGFAF